MAGTTTLSSAVRTNLLSLQSTANALAKTQEKLATGLKVNSALDDPTAFFTASSLNSRANDLSRLQDFVGNSVQTLKAADEGIQAITKLVESAEATARQALNSAGNTATATGTVDTSGGAVDFTDATITGNVDLTGETDIGANVAGIADGDSFTVSVGGASAVTITIADGDGTTELLADLNAVTGLSASLDDDGNLSLTAGGESIQITEGTNTPAAALGLSTTLTETTNSAGTAYGDSFSVQVGSGTATTVTFGNGTGEVDTADEVVAALNAIDNVSASVGDDGTISIEATNGEDLVLTEGTGTPLDDLGITAGTTAATENTDRTAFAAQFDELRTQINQLAADASFNGNNLLAGDSLSVTFNEDSSSSLTVTGVNFDSAGLGIDSSTDTFQKDSDINAALSDLTAATNTLRSQSSKFGSNLSVVETRQDFTKNLINVLETGAANLTLADTNEEGANLLALQTRQQLSSTSLSLASQADQNVLRLF